MASEDPSILRQQTLYSANKKNENVEKAGKKCLNMQTAFTVKLKKKKEKTK